MAESPFTTGTGIIPEHRTYKDNSCKAVEGAYMNIHQTIATNVREFREKRGISQEGLAEIIGVDRTYISKIERGDRNTTAETLARIADGLGTVPHVLLVPNYFDSHIGHMEVNLFSLAETAERNPSLMSFIIGYQAEYMARQLIAKQLGISAESITKPDDHDRTQHGDLHVPYGGRTYSVEVKCLQTNYVRALGDDRWTGKFQCDGSDATDVTLPNGETYHTVAYRYGLFDIVAVGLFAFGEQWRFAFIKAEDLAPMPESNRARKDRIPNYAKKYFIKSMQDIEWPLKFPYVSQIRELL